MTSRALVLAVVLAAGIYAQPTASLPFAPLRQWQAAVSTGDESAIRRFYSANPPASAQIEKDRVSVQDEVQFWAGLKGKVSSLHTKLLEISKQNGATYLVIRALGTNEREHMPVYAVLRQTWLQEGATWKIAATRHSEFVNDETRTLPQPPTPKTDLYSDPAAARAELAAASARAAKANKRVIVVFGGNWCYDCHVLDATFKSAGFAPLVKKNFEVVHINIGDDGKSNNDLARELGVALDRGVPSLGVLEPNGKVVFAQKDGAFEATEKIGPKDVRAFLEKWKLVGNISF